MKEQLLKLKEAALEEIKAVSAIDELDSIKVKYSGKKGELTKLLKGMGKLSAEERPVMGKVANEVRELIETKINEKREMYNQAKAETPREIELVILKNRYGSSTGTHNYKYYPKFNLFEEMDCVFEEVTVTDNQEAISLFE